MWSFGIDSYLLHYEGVCLSLNSLNDRMYCSQMLEANDVVLIYSQLCSTPLYICWWYCLGWLFMLWSFSGSVLYIRTYSKIHDDVIKWKHFPRNWPFVREIHRSPVNFPHKGQWRGASMFSLIYAWINDWVNNREAGDLRRQHGHYDVIVMY